MNRRAIVLAALLLLPPLALPALAGADPWIRVGPDSGFVLALAAAPSSPSTVYAGLSLGGAFRSVDGGATWSLAGAGLDLRDSVLSLVVDAHRPGLLWSGTVEGIYRSENGGGLWTRQHLGGATALIQNPATGVLYAGELGGPILRSADGGFAWQPIVGSPHDVNSLAIDPVQPRTLFAATATGLFRSPNEGVTWFPLTRGLPAAPINAVAIDPRSRTLYAATASVVAGQIVFRSDDGGQHWASVDSGGLGFTTFLTVGSDRKRTVWAVSAGRLFRSPDRGRTWNAAGAGIPEVAVNTLLAGAGTLLAGTGAGVFRSAAPGASWSLSSRGLNAATITGLALDPLRPLRLWASSSASAVYRTTSGGEPWALLPGAPGPNNGPGPLAADPRHPGTAYLGRFGGVARTVDAGNHWSALSDLPCLVPESIAVDPLDSSVVYVAGEASGARCGLPSDPCSSFRSDDAGQHWTCTQVGRILVPDPLQLNRVYALTGDDDVEVSDDRGGSWSLLAAGFGFEVLVPDPKRPGTLWAGGPDGLFRSDDGGRTWIPAGDGIPQAAPVTAIALDPVERDVLYAGTVRSGVFKSIDGGLTWESLGTGLAGFGVWSLVIDPRDRSTLYAGTDLAGVMKLRQSGGAGNP